MISPSSSELLRAPVISPQVMQLLCHNGAYTGPYDAPAGPRAPEALGALLVAVGVNHPPITPRRHSKLQVPPMTAPDGTALLALPC